MLRVHRKLWFKASSLLTAAATLWFTLAGTAGAAGRAAPRGTPVADVAQRLGVTPSALAGGEPSAADVRAAAERRARALARLAQVTSRDRERAEVQRRAAEIRRAHASDVLASVARAAQDARSAAVAAGGKEPDRRKAAGSRLDAAAVAIRRGMERAQKSGAAVADAPVARAVAKARDLARAAAAASRSEAARAEVQRLAPPRRPVLDTADRRPMMLQKLAPPRPRDRVRLGVAPDPEQRAFYASLLDAPGVQVETEVGPVHPALIGAGFAPSPELALGGIGQGAEALLGLVAAALPAPAPEDLADGVDARITPAIREATAALGNDPLAIFNYVHDGFDAEPYYGSKKGSTGAWEDRAANDADLASVLVAMLRAAGIPARYEYGTVDLTAAQAMAWTGTTDVYQAGDALATSGVPTIVVERETERVVRVEHVWVRAWVPYSNYRGLPRAGSRPAWIRLDPTLKRARIRPATNLRGKVSFDYAGFLATVGSQSPLQLFEQQLRSYAQARGIPCKTLDDLVPARERIADELSLLPAELPARIYGTLATFAGLPSSMRHSASIGLGGFQADLPLPEIAGAALTVRYRGATAADEAAIAAAGSIGQLAQPWTVRVVPTLVMDGTERARGSAVMAGSPQEMLVQLTAPHDAPGVVRHQLFAGAVFAIAFPTGRVADSVVARREAELRQAVSAGATGDDLEAARGNRVLWRWFWNVSRDWDRIFGLEWARAGLAVSEGIAGRTVVSESLYDLPVSIRPGNFVIDVPRLVAGPYMVDGNDRGRLAALFELAGYHGSTWEHLIWEQTVHFSSISTIRILQAARQQGQQLRTITPGDGTDVASLPFSESAREDITNALHRGLVVTIPERPVSWGTYADAEGYILTDTQTGAADYRIKGLYSGGSSNGEGAPPGVGTCPCPPQAPAGSIVNPTSGAMTFSENDLSVPSRGIPTTFTRRYDSSSPYGGRLGPGWQHTYEVRLVLEPDGSVTYVNDRFQAERFARAADGSFAAPPGFPETLAALSDGYRLKFLDGLQYRFRTDGQLALIQDPSGHLVLLTYVAGRLSSVTDPAARTALTFEYDASGLLSAVRDLANRVVQFGHLNGDLVSVTDVLNEVQGYAYDGAHRMISKTDRKGNVTYELYDGAGRWIGSQDPAGFGRSMSYDALNRRALHEDKTGALTVYEYDERGDPVAVTDAMGNRREMGWDAAHHKVWERDARGSETSFGYDGQGNLLSRTDALQGTTAYTYDGLGHVLTVTTNGKLVAQNTYDARGLLETATDALGKVTSYSYTADGLPETITQPGDAVTTLAYNADGTVKSLTDAENGTTTLGYDTNGHLSSVKDPLLQERTLVSDAAGRIRSMTDPLLKTTSFEYDAEGNRSAVVDPDTRRTEFGYDALGRLASVTDAAGAMSRTSFDAEGRVLSRTDPLGRTVSYRYDVAGRLVETEDAAGNVTTQGYCADVSSQACALVDPLGNLTEVHFDALGRVTSIIDANGNSTTEHYDAFGRRDSTTVGGRETRYEHDDAGRLKKVIDALQGITEYGYDDRGNRTSVTDANGKATLFGYDRANRLLWERNPIQPIGRETRYEYDAAGNRRFKTDGNGNRTEYQYDANRRLKKVLFQDGAAYEFDYDARGNRTLEKSPTHERGLAYDALGRLERVEDRTIGRVITYGYDPAGQRSRMELDTGEVTRYRWDAAGRLFEITDPQGEATRFGYDAAGRRTSATYGNGTRATYAYDAVGQVLSIAYLDATGGVQTAFGYGYDAAANRTYKAFADGKKERYGYDALNRLTSVDYPSGRHVEYAYDGVGNRRGVVDTEKSGPTQYAASAAASSQLWPAVWATGPENGSGWMPSRTTGGLEWLEVTFSTAQRARSLRIREIARAPFVGRVDLIDEQGVSHTVFEGGDTTANGNWLELKLGATAYKVQKARIWTSVPIVSGQPAEQVDAVKLEGVYEESYAYNGFNQLTTLTASTGSTTTFGYDDNGNQVRKEDASGITQYVYNLDDRLVGVSGPTVSSAYEYDANGLRTRKTDSGGTTRYLLDGVSVVAQYAPDGQRQAWYTQSLARIDEVLNVVNGAGKFWYQGDALGSIYTLTTASGLVQARGGYDVFGAPVAEYGQAVGQPFGFTGREHELDAGLVYARARYLTAATGRWDRPDPLGFLDGPNRFGYVAQRPTLLTDPSGNFFIGPAIVGGILGGVIGAFVGWASGQSTWDEIRPSILQGIAFGMIAGAFPVLGPSPWAFALSGALVAGFSNFFGQMMALLSGKQTGWQWGPLITSIVIGAVSGLVGGAAAIDGARAAALAGRAVDAIQQAWSITMAATIIGSFVGGLGDALNAMAKRIIVLDAVANDDSDLGNITCIPR